LEFKTERIFVIKENVNEHETETTRGSNEKTGGNLKERIKFVGRDQEGRWSGVRAEQTDPGRKGDGWEQAGKLVCEQGCRNNACRIVISCYTDCVLIMNESG
jgi:hypothetical protein